MVGEIDREKASAIVSNGVLWPKVRGFLWDFAPQIHPDRIAALFAGQGEAAPKAFAATKDSPRTKAWLLARLGVEPCFHDFPAEDGTRLLLLDCGAVQSLVRWMGALACAERLRRVADGASVRALKAALPDVYPAVFRRVAYFRPGDFGGGRAERAEQCTAGVVEEAGLSLFKAFAAGLPGPLVSRFALKMPPSFDGAPAAENPPALKNILKLLKLVMPEAYSICCC